MRTIILLFLCLNSAFLMAQGFEKITVIDSEHRETNISITPNGKYLYFMSQRGGQPWSTERLKKSEDEPTSYDGDIWYCVKEDGEWQAPKPLGNNINTDDGEDEPNITADGQAVYFQSWGANWESNGGPYYRAELDGVVWKNPVGLGSEINRFFRELRRRGDKVMMRDLKKLGYFEAYLTLKATGVSEWDKKLQKKGFNMKDYMMGTDGMAISPNEEIFIVSAFTPEKKQHDLYISRKNEEGEWSYPKPLNIPNDGDEISVFIAGDNKTIYFASDMAGGFGGHDIYKTTLLENTAVGKVINVGEKFNSEKDEYGFVVNASEEIGYMVVDGAIVEVDLTKEEEEIMPEAIQLINGLVIAGDSTPIATNIQLWDVTNNKLLGSAKSNKNTGEYSFSYARTEGDFNQIFITESGLRADQPYTVDATTAHTMEFVIILHQPDAAPEVVKGLGKTDLQVGEVLRVDKLHFAANKAEIQEESKVMLDDLAKALISRPEIVRVEISGHTNGLPSHEYCDKLSTARAKEVYEYLIEKNVEKERLSYQGYGKRVPIATNKTKSGRNINQRVEMKILELKE